MALVIAPVLKRFKGYIHSFFDYPFDHTNLVLPSRPMTMPEAEKLMKQIYELHKDDPEFLEKFDQIGKSVEFLMKISLKHDYKHEDIQVHANGFHTYCDLLLVCCQALLLMHRNDTFDREHGLKILKILIAGIRVCEQLDNDESLFTDKVTFLDLFNLAHELRDELCCIYTHYNSLWLYPCVSKLIQMFGIYMGTYFAHWQSFQLQNCFFLSRERRGEMFTQFSLDCNIDSLKSMWNVSEYWPIKFYLSRSIGFWGDVHVQSITMPRQARWRIATFEHETIVDTHQGNNSITVAKCKKSSIRALMIRSLSARQRDRDVLIHVHGGGFISQSPETHCYYLAEWIQSVKHLTILSIDYTLSPEGPFPEALQEVLDTYLWLTSDSPEVKETLGFRPARVSVCGDSAGGNIAFALLLVLNKLKSLHSIVRLPDSLFTFYAPLVLSTSFISPSRLMVSVDGLIPLAPLLNCLRAYVPDEIFPESTGNQKNNDSWLTQLKNRIIPNCGCEPWFKQKDRIHENMELMNGFLKNPFVSPLLCSNFEFTKSVSLYAIGTTYDPFLDDAIELAKRWQGPKKLLIIPRLPHGFLNLVKVSEKASMNQAKIIEFLFDAFC